MDLVGSTILRTEALERGFFVKQEDRISSDSDDFRGAVNQSLP
jgi:hypothetical protein